MDYSKKIIIDLELHSVEGIRTCFENGISPNQVFDDKTLFEELVGGYLRSTHFKNCVKTFLEFGLKLDDQPLLAVLLDDRQMLEQILADDPTVVSKRYTLKSAFTPLEDVTLLHICAEFNHLSCAQALLDHQADVNAKAGVDDFGFGGQTPVFHTVNQHNNFCLDTLKLLIDHAADLNVSVKGLIWGKGHAWETYIPAVNPISYTLMGLLPQFHRKEVEIYENVQLLMREAFQINYQPFNVPNRYLAE